MSSTRLFALALGAAVVALAPRALAHPVTVDGNPTEWMLRAPNAQNLGIVARDAQQRGEYVWLDALNDTRTDLATPEVVADIAAFQVTGDATGVSFLLRRQQGVSLAGAPIQIQIAVDIDRVAGSGQEFFAEFADTKVADGARWERLVETLFGSGGTAKVIDTSFNQVATAAAVVGANGDIEIGVPWIALGLAGPPAAPLRFTVATFRAQNNDLTIDIGGAMFSNALDAITNYGNPTAAAYPNTYAEVQDQIVDYSFDVWFGAAGEVYAPLVVDRVLANSSGGGSDEWYMVQNASPAPLALDNYRIGDEETPDGNEAMFGFPAGATLAPGARYVVARAGASYQAFFGSAPDAELPPGASMAVPDMVAYTPWTNGVAGNLQLANAGDELLVLDPSATIVDVLVYGNGVYLGINSSTPAPGTDQVLVRNAGQDTDDCDVDFSIAGTQCTSDAQCGGGSPCSGCVANVCGNDPQGTSCADADACNGDETCDGNGACVAGIAPTCDDANACTTDGCAPATGCTHVNVASGTPCGDGDLCNGDEICDGSGVCQAGAPPPCDDGDPCTANACDPTLGCQFPLEPVGTACPDGDTCNGDESCDANGSCTPGSPLLCDDTNECTADGCDAATGCTHDAVADGTACGDANCSGVCASGQCDCGTGGAGGGTGGSGATGGGGAGASGGAGGAGASGGAGGSTSSSSSSGSGTGGSEPPEGLTDDGGCGCRVATERSAWGGWLLGLAALGALRRRRRAR